MKVRQARIQSTRTGADRAEQGTGRIYRGKCPKKADVSLIVSDKDMVQLALGQMSPQKAFLTGKIKVKGNLMLGLRMNDLLSTEVAKLSKL